MDLRRQFRVVLLLAVAGVLLSGPQAYAQSEQALEALNRRVIGLYREGKPGEALPLAEQYADLTKRLYGEGHPKHASSLLSLAFLYQAQGRLAEAEPLSNRAVEIVKKALPEGHPDIATALNSLAVLYQAQGRLAEAEPLHKRALEMREKALPAGHRDIATSLNNLAALYAAQGRPAEAEPFVAHALAIYEKVLPAGHPDIATALDNLAVLYQAQGRLAEAEPLFKRALEMTEKALPTGNFDIATSLNSLAGLYVAQGRLAEAEPLYGRALEIYVKALPAGHPYIAQNLTYLALLYLRQGRLAEAEPLFIRALEMREKALPAGHPDIAQGLNNLAGLYQERGRLAEAEPLFRRALAMSEKALPEDHPSIAIDLSNLGDLQFRKGHLDEALELVRRLTAIFIRRDQSSTAPEGDTRRSEIAQKRDYFRRHVQIAWRAAERDPDRASALGDEGFRMAQFMLQSAAARALSQMALRFAKDDPALGVLVRARQDLDSQWQAADKQLNAALSLAAERRGGADERARRRLGEIDARRDAIDKDLKNQFPDYFALARPQPLSVGETTQLLRADEALVFFAIGGEESYVFALTRERFEWRPIAAADTLSELAARVMRPMRPASARGLDENETATARPAAAQAFGLTDAHALYQAVLAPVADAIKDKAHWIFVPDGPLAGVPMQLLVASAPTDETTTKTAAWLVRDHAMSVLPAVSSLRSLRQSANARTASLPFVGFGDPLIGGDVAGDPCALFRQLTPQGEMQVAAVGQRGPARPMIDSGIFAGGGFTEEGIAIADVDWLRRQARLAESRCEVEALARLQGADIRAAVFVGARATEAMVKELSAKGELRKYRVVAFATHGLLPTESRGLAEAGLILTPPPKGSAEDDGLLTASEVARLELDADWVILSACNTASGDAAGAQALSGLARAFFFAGARSLLVSHWPVNSRAAVLLTTRALAEIEREPTIGKAEAMRRSMLSLLADDVPQVWSQPQIWAPFSLVGEGG